MYGDKRPTVPLSVDFLNPPPVPDKPIIGRMSHFSSKEEDCYEMTRTRRQKNRRGKGENWRADHGSLLQ